jgi:hypothetical protein
MSFQNGKLNPSYGKLKYKNILTYNFLYENYILKQKSIVLLSKETGIRTSSLENYLLRNKIKIRTKSESQKLFLKNNVHPLKGKSLSFKTKRLMSLVKRGISGKNHPRFGKNHTIISKKKISIALGGTGTPYQHNKYDAEFFRKKNTIRERDNYTCQKCFKKDGQFYKIEVHHIDYDKKNNKDNNLICLCHLCNVRANFNRTYWKQYYQKKMKEILK